MGMDTSTSSLFGIKARITAAPDRQQETGSPRIVVIVPTFNERENISELACRVFAVAREHALDLKLLVVDDCSPDGTAEAVRREAGRFPDGRLQVLERIGARRDLAGAVIDGIRATREEIIAVMDADLTHRPEEIPTIVGPIQRGQASFVVGSRYLRQSKKPTWGLLRKLNSLIPTVLSRPLVRISDPMSGFFAFKRSILADGVKLSACGFKIGLDLLVRTAPFAVGEVPISFEERRHGRSKLSLRQQVRFLKHLVRLYRFTVRKKVQLFLAYTGIKMLPKSS
jgi:dolichol-phosphate mannosyltransferase